MAFGAESPLGALPLGCNAKPESQLAARTLHTSLCPEHLTPHSVIAAVKRSHCRFRVSLPCRKTTHLVVTQPRRTSHCVKLTVKERASSQQRSVEDDFDLFQIK